MKCYTIFYTNLEYWLLYELRGNRLRFSSLVQVYNVGNTTKERKNTSFRNFSFSNKIFDGSENLKKNIVQHTVEEQDESKKKKHERS